MKNIIILFVINFSTFFSNSQLSAQKGFFFGFENGFKFDKSVYSNSVGKILNNYPISLSLQAHLGYRYNNSIFEIAYSNSVISSSIIEIEYSNFTPIRSHQTLNTDLHLNTIPFRIGWRIPFFKSNFVLNPQIGLLSIFTGASSIGDTLSIWGYNVNYYSDPNFVNNGSDSSIAYLILKNNLTFGIEYNLLISYEFQGHLDLFARISSMYYIHNLYFTEIKHWRESKEISAQNVPTGLSWVINLGVRIRLLNK